MEEFYMFIYVFFYRYEYNSEKVPTFFSIEKPSSTSKSKQSNMVVNKEPQKEYKNTSSNETSPSHESFTSGEQPSSPMSTKSTGSSTSHEFSPQTSKSPVSNEINSSAKSKKKSSSKVGKTRSKTDSRASEEKQQKRSVSNSAGSSPSHLPSPVKSPVHKIVPDKMKNEPHSNNKTEVHHQHLDHSKESSLTGSTDVNRCLDNNVNNNDGNVRVPNTSNFEIQTLHCEPKSPIRHTVQDTKTQQQYSTPLCDKQVLLNTNSETKISTENKDSVPPQQNTKKSSPRNRNRKKEKPSSNIPFGTPGSEVINVESPRKYSPPSADKRKDKTEKSQKVLSHHHHHDRPAVNNNNGINQETVFTQNSHSQIHNSSKNKSPAESPTRSVQPSLVSSPVQGGYHLDPAVPSGSGPSSPESDTGSIYHQPLKEVDLPSAQRLAKRLFELEGFQKKDISKHLSKK